MMHLLEFNQNYKKNLNYLQKEGETVITTFYLKVGNKDSTKCSLENLRKIKQETSTSLAVIVILEKVENYIPGFINSLKNEFDFVIGMGGLNKTNRYFLEHTNIDFLLDPHSSLFSSKIDFMHHFNSGINHILAKYARDKEIGFIFTLNFLDNFSKRDISRELGRLNQNLVFAEKYGIDIHLGFLVENFYHLKSKEELRGIYHLFDISNKKIKDSLFTLENRLKENEIRSSPNYISKGIKIIE